MARPQGGQAQKNEAIIFPGRTGAGFLHFTPKTTGIMATETERKFLVQRDKLWLLPAEKGIPILQGYLHSHEDMSIRVRMAGKQAFLTIKGKSRGLSRPEFEYEIPAADAVEMLRMCGEKVEKIRYKIPLDDFCWEVDVFSGANEGLMLAEIELASEDQAFPRPDWLGEEVSFDSRYQNACLAKNPFSRWQQ
jgi:adenylate cyclase